MRVVGSTHHLPVSLWIFLLFTAHFLDIPTTAIHGSKDLLSTPKYSVSWAAYTSRDATLCVLPNANHLFLLEDEVTPTFLGYLCEVVHAQLRVRVSTVRFLADSILPYADTMCGWTFGFHC